MKQEIKINFNFKETKIFFYIKKIMKHTYFRQILTSVIIQLMTFSQGLVVGSTSPILHYLQSNNATVPLHLTVDEASWMVSLIGLGMLLGNLIIGFLLNRIGRKGSMSLMALPYLLACILQYLSASVEFIYVDRFLFGVSTGGTNAVTYVFISEIVDPNIRGSLSSMAMCLWSFGYICGTIAASYLNYYLLPVVFSAFPVLYLLLSLHFHETPKFLLLNLKLKDARCAFYFYKNAYGRSEAELLKLSKEYEILQSTITEHKGQDGVSKITFKDIAHKEVLMSLLTGSILVITCHFSGCFALFNYMSTIFETIGYTQLKPNTCTLITAMAQFVGTFCTICLTDRYGRKFLMLLSTGGMALGLIAFGYYVQYMSKIEQLLSCHNWLPLLIMIWTVFISSVGLVPLVLPLFVEIQTVKLRTLGSSLCNAFYSCMVFVALKIFLLILHFYGLPLLMFMCGAVCIIGWFYFLVVLKETKGCSLDD